MRVGSLFSGVGGIDLGLERAGHRVVFQCEQDPYCRRVLARHWPGVPCANDVREVDADWLERLEPVAESRADVGSGGGTASGIQLLAGGFPCQDLSVAGKRAGLAGARSGLFFEFMRVADALCPPGSGRWLLLENVPGLLSSNGGEDFAVILGAITGYRPRVVGRWRNAGWCHGPFGECAWRVLDSRYLGVPQRRRRVFILARRAGGRRAAEVLLEPESGGGDFEAGREARARVAASLSRVSAGPGVSAPGRRQEDDENIIADPLVARSSRGKPTPLAPGHNTDGHVVVAPALTQRYGKVTDSDVTDAIVVNALDRKGGGADDNDAQAGHLVAGAVRSHMRPGSNDVGGIVAHPLRAEGFDASEDGTGRGTPLVADGVRAPSGLPGWMDVGAVKLNQTGANGSNVTVDHVPTLDADARVAHNGQGSAADSCALDPRPDGPRYAACGNAVTVNVAEWIGRRLTHLQPDPPHPQERTVS